MVGIPSAVADPLGTYFESIFFDLLMGLLNAQSLEVGFNELRIRERRLTEEQIKVVARYASAYYVERLNSRRELSRREIHALKLKAINSALRQLDDEE